MSKKKNSVEAESFGHSGDKPGGDERPPVLVGPIETEAQAISLVKTLYTVPEYCKTVIVTEDRNVFWQENASAAVNHAKKNNLKIFRLPWD